MVVYKWFDANCHLLIVTLCVYVCLLCDVFGAKPLLFASHHAVSFCSRTAEFYRTLKDFFRSTHKICHFKLALLTLGYFVHLIFPFAFVMISVPSQALLNIYKLIWKDCHDSFLASSSLENSDSNVVFKLQAAHCVIVSILRLPTKNERKDEKKQPRAR